jgi:hypothetical protein
MIINVSHKYKNFIVNPVHIRNAMWMKEIANVAERRINDIPINPLRKIESDDIITVAVPNKAESSATIAD